MDSDPPHHDPIGDVWLVQRLLESVESTRAALRKVGISQPLYVCWSLTGMKSRTKTRSIDEEVTHVDLDVLEFPPLLLKEDGEFEPLPFLKPWLDLLWNAFGAEFCPVFDPQSGEERWSQFCQDR